MRSIAFFGSAVVWMASQVASADCPRDIWPEPAKRSRVIKNFEQARQSLEKSYLMKLEKIDDPSCEGMQIWKVIDNRTKLDLVNIPIPVLKDGSPDIAALLTRVSHVYRTPKRELRALADARKQFLADQADVRATLGVYFAYPGDANLNQIQESELGLRAEMRMCVNEAPLDGVIDSSIKVNMFEYSPSKRRYLPEDLYRQGQIRARLVKNPEALRKLAEAAGQNAANCIQPQVGSGPHASTWAELASRFSALAGPKEASPEAVAPAASPQNADSGSR